MQMLEVDIRLLGDAHQQLNTKQHEIRAAKTFQMINETKIPEYRNLFLVSLLKVFFSSPHKFS